MNERSTSRWQGQVFSVVLQDATGDIRATGFNEQATKFHPIFKEGSIFYVSHAQVGKVLGQVKLGSFVEVFRKKPSLQVKPIHNRKYNHTTHNYELGLNQNTVVVECRRQKQGEDDLPTLLYQFVKMKELDHKQEGDSVDVLGVCTEVDDVKEVRYT